MVTIESKKLEIHELTKEHIPDGAVIAIGGVHSHNVPMSLVRQIIRIGSKDLTLVGSISAGLPIDILVGTGQVKTVLSPYVGLEMWGLAPNFRRAVQNKTIVAPDLCEAFPVYSLRAAKNGISFHPFPGGIHLYSDIHKNNEYYKEVIDPFTNEKFYAVQALAPDIAIIHVQKASDNGNCIHTGSIVTDELMAGASKLTIVTCEELISDLEIQQNSDLTSIPSFYVDYVIHQPLGAYPTSSHGHYIYDEIAIKEYIAACNDETTFSEYIENLKIPEKEYLADKPWKNREEPPQADYEKQYNIAELMSILFSRTIEDNTVGICGAVSDIPMAAMMLAEKTHAPAMKWIAGGSGYVNPRGYLVPSSTDFQMATQAEMRFSMNEVIPIEMQNLDFFFAGGLQIDGRGNTNLAGIPTDDGWKLRGPGSVGLAFLPRAKNVFLYTMVHNKRVLVDKVDYISGPGHSEGKNPYGGGPKLLITNLCVFEWDSSSDIWRLESLHPGIALDQIIDNTGFKFKYDETPKITEEPTTDELKILRDIDPWGVLTVYG